MTDSFSRLLSQTSTSFQDFRPSQTAEGACEFVAGGLIIGSLLVPGVAEIDAAASALTVAAQTYATTTTFLEGAIALDTGTQKLTDRAPVSHEDWAPLIRPQESLLSKALPGVNTKPEEYAKDLLSGAGLERAGSVISDICSIFGSWFSDTAKPEAPPPAPPPSAEEEEYTGPDPGYDDDFWS